MEDSMSLAQWYVNLELLGKKLVTPEDRLKKIMAVKLPEIKKVARELFNLRHANLAVIGPFKDRDRFLKMLK